MKALRVEDGFDIVHLETVEVIAEMAAHGVAFVDDDELVVVASGGAPELVDVVARTARCVGPSNEATSDLRLEGLGAAPGSYPLIGP